MKKIIILSVLGLFLLGFFGFVSNVYAVHVNGYYRSNGTYVNGYERTAPDGNPYNNYSYPGNYNPNTGSITGGSASTYLNNYYKNSSGSSYSSGYTSPSYTYPSYLTTPSYPITPSCPLMSTYDSISDNCKCYSGYIVSGSSCVSATLYCSNTIGLMSKYNSLSKQCECMAGYIYNGSSCVSYNQSCQKQYGLGSYGDKDNCYCSIGYKWNDSNKTACIVAPVKTENESCQDTYGINSYSPTSGKCGCNAGYQWASDNKSCVVASIKTNEQICQDSFGLNAIWNGTKNTDGTLNCNCKTGFSWKDSNKTSCVIAINANSQSNSLVFTKDLKLGSTGVDVSSLQNFLKNSDKK